MRNHYMLFPPDQDTTRQRLNWIPVPVQLLVILLISSISEFHNNKLVNGQVAIPGY